MHTSHVVTQKNRASLRTSSKTKEREKDTGARTIRPTIEELVTHKSGWGKRRQVW